MRTPTAVALAAALALGACSSDDDDDPSVDPDQAMDQTTDPATSGPAPGGPGDTSMPAPGTNPDAPPSSEPGGDTSAVAGLWDASDEGAPGSDYVDIADDGLWTRYELDADGSNCFEVDGPYTLMLEIEETNEYSISAEDEGVTLVASGDVMTVRFGADGEVEDWPRVQGLTVADIEPLCEASED